MVVCVYYPYACSLTNISIALADADSLGKNPNFTFDEAGGLDDRTFCILRYLEKVLMSSRLQLSERDNRIAFALSGVLSAFQS